MVHTFVYILYYIWRGVFHLLRILEYTHNGARNCYFRQNPKTPNNNFMVPNETTIPEHRYSNNILLKQRMNNAPNHIENRAAW